jgi:MATE family multidrug resistance protein
MGLVSGVIAAGLLAVTTAHALPLMVDDPKMVASATRYLDVRVWGLPLTLTAFGLMSGLQGLGDSKARMQASVAGNAVNIVLDIVLVFGLGPFPRMEEAGAALATVIGAFVMLTVYAWRYRRLFGMPRLPGAEVLRSALTVGLPAGSQALIETIAFATMNIVLARVGPVHLAASGIVLNIVSVSFLPGYALAEAGAILVGRYVGAGSSDAAKRSLRTSRSLALAFMGVCGLLFAIAGAEIVGLFTRDQEVVALAAQLMLVAAAFQLFDAVAMVHLSVLRAVGDTRYTLLVTSLASWTLLVPAVFALGLWAGWGAVGAWVGLLAEIAFLAAITAWRVPGIYDGRVVQMKLLLGRGS